jgi:acyl-CoA thioesterase YciA
MDNKTSEEIISHMRVFPAHANPAGNMFGGKIVELMDSSAGISADYYAECLGSVTASISAISFDEPVHIGDVLRIGSRVVYTGHTSMVIKVHIIKYDKGHPPGIDCNTAYLTFIAMDANRKPTAVPTLKVVGEKEQKEWNIAKALHEQALKLKSIKGIKP